MSYSVTLPLTGYQGWVFLKRTQEKQETLLAKAPAQQRDEEYFRDKIGSITSAADLMSDRKLLRVALGAFGLSEDINNTFFIRKVLESDTSDSKSLASKLSDTRYRELSEAFGFGSSETPNTKLETFPDKIISLLRSSRFEEAVGNVDNSMRIALYAETKLPALAADDLSEKGKWYTVLGSEPLQTLFQTALGMPASTSSLDVDQQVNLIMKKAKSVFGDSSVSQFTDPEKLQNLLKKYVILAEVQSSSFSSVNRGAAALMILQSGRQS